MPKGAAEIKLRLRRPPASLVPTRGNRQGDAAVLLSIGGVEQNQRFAAIAAGDTEDDPVLGSGSFARQMV